jgi:hypothetical protein
MIAQDHDVPIAEIGEQARALVGVSPRAFVVVIGDIADHLQRMLVERQQPVLLHRHGAAGDRVRVQHASQLRPSHMYRTGDREATAVDLAVRGLDLVAPGIDLDQ